MKRIFHLNTVILMAAMLLAPLTLMTPAASHAREPNPAQATLARLAAAYRGTTTLSADFVQTSRFVGFNTVKTFGGHLELVRPDRMRWDYQTGSDQQIYLNNRQVTVYAPASKQAIVSTLTPASDRQIPLHLLADVTGIQDTYRVDEGLEPGSLHLTPVTILPGAPEAVYLWLDPDSGLIARVRLDLPGGSRSEIVFDGFDTDSPVADERFVFDAPKGVYVAHPASLFPSR